MNATGARDKIGEFDATSDWGKAGEGPIAVRDGRPRTSAGTFGQGSRSKRTRIMRGWKDENPLLPLCGHRPH